MVNFRFLLIVAINFSFIFGSLLASDFEGGEVKFREMVDKIQEKELYWTAAYLYKLFDKTYPKKIQQQGIGYSPKATIPRTKEIVDDCIKKAMVKYSSQYNIRDSIWDSIVNIQIERQKLLKNALSIKGSIIDKNQKTLQIYGKVIPWEALINEDNLFKLPEIGESENDEIYKLFAVKGRSIKSSDNMVADLMFSSSIGNSKSLGFSVRKKMKTLNPEQTDNSEIEGVSYSNINIIVQGYDQSQKQDGTVAMGGNATMGPYIFKNRKQGVNSQGVSIPLFVYSVHPNFVKAASLLNQMKILNSETDKIITEIISKEFSQLSQEELKYFGFINQR